MIVVNGHTLKPTVFPDGTSQVWHLPPRAIRKNNCIVWTFENDAEIFHLWQLRDLLDANGSEKTILEVDYLPYARQDKNISNDASFALRSFASAINTMRFDEVRFVDVHSDKALDLIDNAFNQSVDHFIDVAIKCVSPDVLAMPDDGAHRRYGVYEIVGAHRTVFGKKKRVAKTGPIKYTGLIGEPFGSVLIIDDICDGGMTFQLFAKLLYEEGAEEVHLYVTHGLFSKGLKPLRDAGIRRIFTMNGEVR